MSSPDDIIQTMVHQAQRFLGAFRYSLEADLVATFMKCGVTNKYSFDQLTEFRIVRLTKCLGFWRDKTHFAGVYNQRTDYTTETAIAVRTTGTFGGEWIFMLDSDRSVLASCNDTGVSEWEGLEGAELIEAVITSALTEELTPKQQRKQWRFGKR